MSRPRRVFISILAVTALLSGCSVLPARVPQPQLHDFGPLPALAGGSSGSVRVDRVLAPAWIDDGSIHYRLIYQDATRLHSYAEQRWVAPPSDMFRWSLQPLLQGTAAAPSRPGPVRLLTIELLEFEQDFTDARQAEARLVLQATLRQALDGQILGQKQFAVSAASSPDAQGAVAGLSKAAQEAAGQVAAWCQDMDR